MDQIEILMHTSLPPSPTSSPTHLRLGGNNSNLRLHRGGSTSSTIQAEHLTTKTIEASVMEQQRCNQVLADAIRGTTSSVHQQKEDMPSTPDRNAQPSSVTSFSSPFSDASTPTKVLDVARRNC